MFKHLNMFYNPVMVGPEESKNTPFYRLPPKADGSPYSLIEMLNFVDPAIQNAYHSSFRVKLALQSLQKEVEKAAGDAAKRPDIYPQNENEAFQLRGNAVEAAEFHVDLTKARLHTHSRQMMDYIDYQTEEMMDLDKTSKDGQPHTEVTPETVVRELKTAADDPLRMARKHAVMLIDEEKRKGFSVFDKWDDRLEPYGCRSINQTACEVQDLIMLMADNALNHHGHEKTANIR